MYHISIHSVQIIFDVLSHSHASPLYAMSVQTKANEQLRLNSNWCRYHCVCLSIKIANLAQTDLPFSKRTKLKVQLDLYYSGIYILWLCLARFWYLEKEKKKRWKSDSNNIAHSFPLLHFLLFGLNGFIVFFVCVFVCLVSKSNRIIYTHTQTN